MNMKQVIALYDVIEPKCEELGIKPMFRIVGSEVMEFSVAFKKIKNDL